MSKIVISGGTGLIGKRLIELLEHKGHNVFVLSRKRTSKNNSYLWDIASNYIDPEAIIDTDYIIHLAGENIAGKRWTNHQKKAIIESRTLSTKLLFEKVKELNPALKGFISASGIGFYGAITSNKTYIEEDSPGTDFISKVCIAWENSVQKFTSLKIRTVILRTGIVLSKSGGALEKMAKPIRFGVGASLGSGEQFMPWIHIDDLCNLYIQAIENNEFNGIYNAVSPEHNTNNSFTKTLATALNKRILLPNIPTFVLQLIFGEMSKILTEGSKVSSEKIEKMHFKFSFPTLSKALQNLLQ